MDDRELLGLQADTGFRSDASGRISVEHDPGHRPTPRMYLARCPQGHVLRIRRDVGDDTARAIERLAADEPPLAAPDAGGEPPYLAGYLRLLGAEAPIEQHELGLVWALPAGVKFDHTARLVRSATPEGDALIARLISGGMPTAMVALGFVDTDEFWPPWCVALEGGEIASIAFAARIGPNAAEVGVTTMPAFRGRGYAAAVTAGWADHPALGGRPLFYSTSGANRSSQRVVERLGLRFLGTSLRIS